METQIYHTNATNPDTDGDGLTDGQEVLVYGTDPNNNDTDSDGLSDYAEIFTYHTNPTLSDSDMDGIGDYAEIFTYHTDPMNADTDADGIKDGAEIFVYHTDPLNNDTDGDGVLDGVEVTPYLVILTNGTQFFSISNPLSNDTDHDGLTDYQERYIYHTASDRNDTDGDRFSDGVEVLLFMTNPLDPSNDPITNLEHAIAMLPDSVFASPLSRQDALFNMLNATRAIIASDDFSNAYNKLVNSFRPKLDPNAGARSWVVKDTGLLPYIDLLIEMIYASIGKSVINLPY